MAAGTLVGILALSACTEDEPRPDPTPTPTPRFETPLAVVTHLSRDVDDLTIAQARTVADGDAFDWKDLGSKPGPLRVVGTVDEVAEDPEAVAVVPVDEVTPRVRALTVDGEDPLTAGDDFMLRQPSNTRPGAVVRTTIVGDIMLGRRVGDSLEQRGDPTAVFRPLAKRLASADITVGNLESTLSMSGPPRQGTDSFGADTSVLEGLRMAGFDLLSVANNHLGDFGENAIVETLERLDDAGFRTVGAGANLGHKPLSRSSSRFTACGWGSSRPTRSARPRPPAATPPAPTASTLPRAPARWTVEPSTGWLTPCAPSMPMS